MAYKPMLATKAPDDLTKVKYPVLVSPKLDGIRCIIKDGKAVSRKLKLIPNRHIQETLQALDLPEGLDGELVLYDWTAPFNEVTSAVMKRSGMPDFVFAVFDLEVAGLGFQERLNETNQFLTTQSTTVQRVPHWEAHDAGDVRELLTQYLAEGFEGVMLRDPQGPYKYGRSTVKEGYLLKVKNFEDEEATVLGMIEQMQNNNPLERDNLGNAKRSTAKEGKAGKGILGALVCQFKDGAVFQCGTGFTHAQRRQIWEMEVEGLTAKIKHQPDPGGRPEGGAPRFPVFLGFRDMEIDG